MPPLGGRSPPAAFAEQPEGELPPLGGRSPPAALTEQPPLEGGRPGRLGWVFAERHAERGKSAVSFGLPRTGCGRFCIRARAPALPHSLPSCIAGHG